ncbi:MAG: VWA domain-containing protein [Sphingobacteriales bacterium]|nr:MAG: VWA domain-containing protein [Sphingobacteriales bacterium]
MKDKFAKYSLLVLLTICLHHSHAWAQLAQPRATRILLVLDASSSMSQDWKNSTKYKDAAAFILRLMDEAYKYDSTIEFAMRVYGHQYPARYRQCYDSKHEVQFSRDNKQQMMMRLENIQPKGVASVAYSVKESIQNINFKDRYEYILVTITDGGESCEGNFCESLEALKKYAPVTTHVLHLADVKETRLSCADYYYLANDASIEQHAIENILQKYKTPRGQAQPVPTMERLAPTPGRPQIQPQPQSQTTPPVPKQEVAIPKPKPEPPVIKTAPLAEPKPQPATPATVPATTQPLITKPEPAPVSILAPIPATTPVPTPASPATETEPIDEEPQPEMLMTSPADDVLGYGVLSLTGLDSAEVKDLQIEDRGRYAHYDRYNASMQPQGPKMVHKLKPGNYKLLYRKGVDQVWHKFFTIKDGQITDVKL